MISSSYEAFFITLLVNCGRLSHMQQNTVQKDIIISDAITIITIHLSSSLSLQHMGLGAGEHCGSSSGTLKHGISTQVAHTQALAQIPASDTGRGSV